MVVVYSAGWWGGLWCANGGVDVAAYIIHVATLLPHYYITMHGVTAIIMGLRSKPNNTKVYSSSTKCSNT